MIIAVLLLATIGDGSALDELRPIMLQIPMRVWINATAEARRAGLRFAATDADYQREHGAYSGDITRDGAGPAYKDVVLTIRQGAAPRGKITAP